MRTAALFPKTSMCVFTWLLLLQVVRVVVLPGILIDVAPAAAAALPADDVDEDNCQDLDDSCSFYAQAGECQANAEYMLETCRKSCNACPKPEKKKKIKEAPDEQGVGKGHDSSSSPARGSNTRDDDCSSASDLRRRIKLAYGPNGVVSPHDMFRLHGVIDDVLSPSECHLVNSILTEDLFAAAGSQFGYGGKSAINTPKAYAGLSLNELVPSSAAEGQPASATSGVGSHNYTVLLNVRSKVHETVEAALNLCPSSLKVDYTHYTEKRPGGKHDPHADNCFVSERGVAQCMNIPGLVHPYPHRLVASILYLNDDFDGGEFYWADYETREPREVIQAKPGRLMVFTAGPEGLHGALPVREKRDEGAGGKTSRRLALGMWYNDVDDEAGEIVPEYDDGGHREESGGEDDEL